MTEVGHYEAVSAAYEEAFFYASGPYQDWLLSTVLEHLRLEESPALRLADVGGGTGNFTAELCAAAQLVEPALCVDNSPEMLELAAARPRLAPLCLDAVAFARREPEAPLLDRVLLKEVVHHIPEADVPALYAGLAAQLAAKGVVLTVTRPQEVDYPLFECVPAETERAQRLPGPELRAWSGARTSRLLRCSWKPWRGLGCARGCTAPRSLPRCQRSAGSRWFARASGPPSASLATQNWRRASWSWRLRTLAWTVSPSERSCCCSWARNNEPPLAR